MADAAKNACWSAGRREVHGRGMSNSAGPTQSPGLRLLRRYAPRIDRCRPRRRSSRLEPRSKSAKQSQFAGDQMGTNWRSGKELRAEAWKCPCEKQSQFARKVSGFESEVSSGRLHTSHFKLHTSNFQCCRVGVQAVLVSRMLEGACFCSEEAVMNHGDSVQNLTLDAVGTCEVKALGIQAD